MKRNVVFLLMLVMLFAAALSGCKGDQGEKPSLDVKVKAFYDEIDLDYSRGVMDKLMSFMTDEQEGFRAAGSLAEPEAGNYLYHEFQKIGLQNVTKDAVSVDSFDFKEAELTYQDATKQERKAELSAFPTQYQAESKENEEVRIVFVGKGTDADYEGIDVSGKIAFLNLDPGDEWRINWSAYQAKVKGAKAIIAVHTDGCGTYAGDTQGVRNFRGPADAPAFTMTERDANGLKKAIAANGGEIRAVLNVDSQVGLDGTSYNIIGEIPGKTSEVIYVIGQYNAYLGDFFDHTAGIGCLVGIAKALVESGYQPIKTIRFIAHGAGGWGMADSRDDWAGGAILSAHKHPDWATDGFMVINLDSGVACGDADEIQITAPYELADGLVRIGDSVKGSPLLKFSAISPTRTRSNSFAYAMLGIPVMDSGYSGINSEGTNLGNSGINPERTNLSYSGINSEETDHFNQDWRQTNAYDEETFIFSHKLYGSYVIAFDQMEVRPFRYTDLFHAMEDTVDEDVIEDAERLYAAYDDAMAAAEELQRKTEMNHFSEAGLISFNQGMNAVYKKAANDLFIVDWREEVQFVHQYKQSNVQFLTDAIKALYQGEVDQALQCIGTVDLNGYAFHFDQTTYNYFMNQVLGAQANHLWGEGSLKNNADLWLVTRSLMTKRREANPDFSQELTALKAELKVQKQDLEEVVEKEIADVNELTAMMKKLAQ